MISSLLFLQRGGCYLVKTFVSDTVIIAVDFDGTITKEPEMGEYRDLELQKGCREALEYLKDIGCDLILWTCRTGEALGQAKSFLQSNDLFHLFTEVNTNHPKVVEKYSDCSRKVAADFYVDDKSTMGNLDWNNVVMFIRQKYGSVLKNV